MPSAIGPSRASAFRVAIGAKFFSAPKLCRCWRNCKSSLSTAPKPSKSKSATMTLPPTLMNPTTPTTRAKKRCKPSPPISINPRRSPFCCSKFPNSTSASASTKSSTKKPSSLNYPSATRLRNLPRRWLKNLAPKSNPPRPRPPRHPQSATRADAHGTPETLALRPGPRKNHRRRRQGTRPQRPQKHGLGISRHDCHPPPRPRPPISRQSSPRRRRTRRPRRRPFLDVPQTHRSPRPPRHHAWFPSRPPPGHAPRLRRSRHPQRPSHVQRKSPRRPRSLSRNRQPAQILQPRQTRHHGIPDRPAHFHRHQRLNALTSLARNTALEHYVAANFKVSQIVPTASAPEVRHAISPATHLAPTQKKRRPENWGASQTQKSKSAFTPSSSPSAHSKPKSIATCTGSPYFPSASACESPCPNPKTSPKPVFPPPPRHQTSRPRAFSAPTNARACGSSGSPPPAAPSAGYSSIPISSSSCALPPYPEPFNTPSWSISNH